MMKQSFNVQVHFFLSRLVGRQTTVNWSLCRRKKRMERDETETWKKKSGALELLWNISWAVHGLKTYSTGRFQAHHEPLKICVLAVWVFRSSSLKFHRSISPLPSPFFSALCYRCPEFHVNPLIKEHKLETVWDHWCCIREAVKQKITIHVNIGKWGPFNIERLSSSESDASTTRPELSQVPGWTGRAWGTHTQAFKVNRSPHSCFIDRHVCRDNWDSYTYSKL